MAATMKRLVIGLVVGTFTAVMVPAHAGHAATSRITIKYDGHRLYGRIISSVPKCEGRLVEVQVRKDGAWQTKTRMNAFYTEGKWRFRGEHEGTWRVVALKRKGCREAVSSSLTI